jgi:hypothetical protein
VRRPRPAAVFLMVAGRFGPAAFKGAIVAVIVWWVAHSALESNTSPYLLYITVGAGIAFVLASIYFVIWPSPLGDPRDWDEIIHVPSPPEPNDDPNDPKSNERRPGR